MPPPEKGEAPGLASQGATPESTSDQQADTPIVSELATPISSQQVSWWDVHEHVAPLLAAAGSFPAAGTPAWCALDDTDPAKTAALFDAAQHWALRVETCQQAKCEASHAISAAADWEAIGQEWFLLECAHTESTYYIPRKTAPDD